MGHLSRFALPLLMLIYLGLTGWNFAPAVAEVDTKGYLWLAERLGSLESVWLKDPSPLAYQEHIWVSDAAGRVTVKYAPGVPLLLALPVRGFGPGAMFFLSPIMGALTLLGIHRLTRQLTQREGPALLAAATLLLHPLFLFHSGYPLTHMTEAALVTWGSWMLLSGRAGVGGLVMGMAVLVRPTLALLLLPVLAGPWRWRAIGPFMVGPLVLAGYQWLVFGAPWRSGYALSGEQNAFTLKALVQQGPGLVVRCFTEYLFLLLPAAVWGLARMTREARRLVMLVMLPSMGLYASYYWMMPGWGWWRFLLFALPLLIAATSAAPRWVMAVALLGQAVWMAPRLTPEVHGQRYADTSLPVAQLQTWLAAHVPREAMLLVDGPLFMGESLAAYRREQTLAELERVERESQTLGTWTPRGDPRRRAAVRAFYQSVTQEQLDAQLRQQLRGPAYLLTRNAPDARLRVHGPITHAGWTLYRVDQSDTASP